MRESWDAFLDSFQSTPHADQMQNLSTTLWYEEAQEHGHLSEAAQSAGWVRLLRERLAPGTPLVDAHTISAPPCPTERSYAAPPDQEGRQTPDPWEWEGKWTQPSYNTKEEEDARWNTWGQPPTTGEEDLVDQPWGS